MKAKFLEHVKDVLTQESRKNGCFREVKYEVKRIRGNRKIGQIRRRSRGGEKKKKNFQLDGRETQNAGDKSKANYNIFYDVLLSLQ